MTTLGRAHEFAGANHEASDVPRQRKGVSTSQEQGVAHAGGSHQRPICPESPPWAVEAAHYATPRTTTPPRQARARPARSRSCAGMWVRKSCVCRLFVDESIDLLGHFEVEVGETTFAMGREPQRH